MSKKGKTEKNKALTTGKYIMRDSRTGAASALSPVGHGKAKTVAVTTVKSHRVSVAGRGSAVLSGAVQTASAAGSALLDPYDWGPQGIPQGQPLRYVPGQGFILED